jgi:2-polyprenyl-3-methyl-5-hydroxy-6-metoxy-1,4-benzoquinol methylase
MSETPWYLAPGGESECDRLDDGRIWRSRQASGQYADLPDATEQEMLDFLATTPWRDGLRQRLRDKPWLAAIITDPRRAAAVLRVPLAPQSRILDVGAGWGQLSIPLAQRGHQVVALDQTPNRLRLLDAISRQEGATCDLLCGDIETAPLRNNTFDLIILNGVLEWTVRDRSSDASPATHQVAVLEHCRSLLAPGGQIFLAIENALGLKYLMGSREDHCGHPWIGLIEEAQAESAWRQIGAPGIKAKTHDLDGYRQLFARAGLLEQHAWGCFPDYKLPSHVIPLHEINRFLMGEASWTEHHGDNGDMISDEWPLRPTYRRFARLGCGMAVAPSFAFILTSITTHRD